MFNSQTVQAALDELTAAMAAKSDNTILKHILYSAQVGLNAALDIAKCEDKTTTAAPNKGQACAFMMQNLSRTGVTKTVANGIAYRFDRQWFRDNVQNGSLDLRTVYYLTEEIGGCILSIAGGNVSFQYVDNDPTGADLNAAWDALK